MSSCFISGQTTQHLTPNFIVELQYRQLQPNFVRDNSLLLAVIDSVSCNLQLVIFALFRMILALYLSSVREVTLHCIQGLT